MRKAKWFLMLPVLLTGCKVTPPSNIEKGIATQVKHKITVRGKNDLNPLPPTQENIRTGRRAFSSYCVVCHGLDGQATDVPFADRMSPPVPVLSSPDVQSYTDGQLKWVIDNGLYPSGMPASKGILTDEQIWQIVDYLRHLPPKSGPGEPKLNSSEAAPVSGSTHAGK